MKRILTFGLTLLVTIVFLSSCNIQSLYPFFTQSTKIDIPFAVGTWFETTDPNVAITFDERTITLHELDDVPEEELEATYFQVNGNYFIDITANQYPFEDNSMSQYLAIPVHSLLKVIIVQDLIVISLLDEEWLDEQVEKGVIDLPVLVSKDSSAKYLYIASSQEWTEFLRVYGESEEAFPESAFILTQKNN